MLRQILKCLASDTRKRSLSTTNNLLYQVSIIGAAGRVGRILSMLLKGSPMINELVLMDAINAAGIGADIAHIDSYSDVMYYTGVENMDKAMQCSDIVVMAAGAPIAESRTKEAAFEANKELVYNVASLKGKVCPEAFFVILTHPIDAMVPLAAEALKHADAYDKKKLFGFTKIDTIRARTFVAEHMQIEPDKTCVPVIGGHMVNTIVPILSAADDCLTHDIKELKIIYDRIRKAEETVIKAKEEKEWSQLSVAYGVSKFCNNLLKALDGKPRVCDVAYVESKVIPELNFFSSIVDLNECGIKGFRNIPDLSCYEKDLLKKAIPDIKGSIEMAERYAQSKKRCKGN